LKCGGKTISCHRASLLTFKEVHENGGCNAVRDPLPPERTNFALHFEKTRFIVPPDGAVEVRFRTNLELYEQGLPDALLQQLGEPETLRQGTFHVSDFFSYRAAWFPDGLAGIYVCRVGIAFTTVAIVLASPELVRKVAYGRRFLPGDFRR
jgi:hypothetical protein